MIKIKNIPRPVARRLAILRIKKRGFWFVDIPRTSSSSVRTELGAHFGFPFGKASVRDVVPEGVDVMGDHLPVWQLQDLLGAQSWERLYTFTVVRNPFARVLSMYRFRKKYNMMPEDVSFIQYVEWHDRHFGEIPFFDPSQSECRRQSDFLVDRSGNLAVSEIFRYEERERMRKSVEERLGVPSREIWAMKSGLESADYREHFTGRAREIIEKVYERDLSEFGYEF